MKKTACEIIKRMLIVLLTVSFLLLTGSGASLQTGAVSVMKETDGNARVFRILLLGCDKAAELADSIMLVTVNETDRQTSILQIPRDTYANYTSRSYKKINGALGALGIDGFREFLEETLATAIDAYVILKPDALVGIVDAIGGVTLDVPQQMRYSDPTQGLEISLSKGETTLTGREAEQFVRFRSGYANADLGRLDAQKLFLRALARQCQGLTFMQMLRVAMSAMTTVRTDLGIHEIVRLAGVLRACDVDEVVMQTMTGLAVRGGSGAWYYAINREAAEEEIQSLLFADEGAEFDPMRRFDRTDNARFHEVYTAKKSDLKYLADQFNR